MQEEDGNGALGEVGTLRWGAGLLEFAIASEGPSVRSVEEGAPEVEGFEIISRLGVGAAGEVWLAEDPEPGRTVALKILHRHGTTGASPEFLQREFRILAKLLHPNLVVLYHGIMTADGRLGLAMEWIDGWPLDEWLHQRPGLTLTEKLELFRGMVAGVAFLHDHGVIHRDLKPANVIVDSNGAAKIVDFGLARLHQEETAAAPDGGSVGVAGTLHFMAPEQASNGKGSRAMAVDVYALGVMFYRILTGRWLRAPEGTAAETLAQVLHPPPLILRGPGFHLPRDLQSILRQTLATDPSLRYHHARELEADLLRFAAKQPVAARKHTLFYLTATFLRRQAPRSALAGAVVLAGLAAAVVIYRQHRAVAERNEANLRYAYDLTSFTLRQLRDELRSARPEHETESLPVRAGYPGSTVQGATPLPLDAAGELDLRYYQALLADLRSATAEGHADYSPALDSIQSALDLFSALSSESPDDPLRLLDAAQARLSFARLLNRTGRLDAAGLQAQKTLLQVERLAGWPGFAAAPLTPLRCDCLHLLARAAYQAGDSAKAVRLSQEMLAACVAQPEDLLVRPENEAVPRLALATSDLATHALDGGAGLIAEALTGVSQATAVCRAAQALRPESAPLTCGLVKCLDATARLSLRLPPVKDLRPLFEETVNLLTALPTNANDAALPLAWDLSGTATEWAAGLLSDPDPTVAMGALLTAHQFITHLRRRGDGRDEVFVRRARLYFFQSQVASRSQNRQAAARPAFLAITILCPRQLTEPDRPDLALLTARALYQASSLAELPQTRWNEECAQHLASLLTRLRNKGFQLTPAQQQELALLK